MTRLLPSDGFHTRPLYEIQQDLIRLLETAARREPKMWGVVPAYEPIEDRYPDQVAHR